MGNFIVNSQKGRKRKSRGQDSWKDIPEAGVSFLICPGLNLLNAHVLTEIQELIYFTDMYTENQSVSQVWKRFDSEKKS